MHCAIQPNSERSCNSKAILQKNLKQPNAQAASLKIYR